MPWTQQNREAEVFFTSLKPDALLLHRFYGKEQLSAPYEFHLDLLSEDPAIDFDKVLGSPVSVRLDLLKPVPSKKGVFQRTRVTTVSVRDDSRWFHGLVREFAHVPNEESDPPELYRYRAVMSPSLWFLSLHTDCRIFQNQKVPDIVKQLLRESGIDQFSKLDNNLFEPREYCVQYNESTFHFISRLLEHEGIHYFFHHDDKSHTILFADGNLRHPPTKGYKTIRFNSQSNKEVEHIWSWLRNRRMQPDRVSLKDFNFKMSQQCTNPRESLLTVKPLPRPDKGSSLEIFEYPGRYDHIGLGESYARIRTEEYRARYETFTGKTTVRGMAPGTSFTLAEHPDPSLNREYLITSCDYKIEVSGYQLKETSRNRAAAEPSEDDRRRTFTCTLNAIVVNETIRFQPARITAKPHVRGPQTAVVTTSSDAEEIYTDQYGRVKVHFFWDRHNPENNNSSCWLRVSMPWAGNRWGGVQIPRKGQEVIVDFLEGDPDQPIITGRVYNAATMPPLSGAGRPGSPPAPTSMKAAAQQMSLRSNSLGQDGASAKGNEITMNDDKGGETLFMHAEKDETHNVNNNRLDTVGANEVRTVGADRTRKVTGNEQVAIGINETVTIGGNASETVTAAKVIDVGTTLMIKAGVSITLQCGASTIHMNQAGVITISGMLITVAGSVMTNIGAPIVNVGGTVVTSTGVLNLVTGAALANVAGATTRVVASGPNIVKGGTVLINT